MPRGKPSRRSGAFPAAGAKLVRTTPGVTCNRHDGKGNHEPWGHKRWLVRGALGLSEEWVALGCKGEGLSLRMEEGLPSGIPAEV